MLQVTFPITRFGARFTTIVEKLLLDENDFRGRDAHHISIQERKLLSFFFFFFYHFWDKTTVRRNTIKRVTFICSMKIEQRKNVPSLFRGFLLGQLFFFWIETLMETEVKCRRFFLMRPQCEKKKQKKKSKGPNAVKL